MKQNKKQLKQSLRTKSELYKMYKDLFITATTEVKFLKKQVELLLSELDAIGALVDDKLVSGLIKNITEREAIDRMCRDRVMFGEEILKGFKNK